MNAYEKKIAIYNGYLGFVSLYTSLFNSASMEEEAEKDFAKGIATLANIHLSHDDIIPAVIRLATRLVSFRKDKTSEKVFVKVMGISTFKKVVPEILSEEYDIVSNAGKAPKAPKVKKTATVWKSSYVKEMEEQGIDMDTLMARMEEARRAIIADMKKGA